MSKYNSLWEYVQKILGHEQIDTTLRYALVNQNLENQKAHTNNTGCIECGHCFAICPKNAIQMKAYDCADEPVVLMNEIDNDKLLGAIKSRKSWVRSVI